MAVGGTLGLIAAAIVVGVRFWAGPWDGQRYYRATDVLSSISGVLMLASIGFAIAAAAVGGAALWMAARNHGRPN